MMNCPACLGTGYIARYSHIDGGMCFGCAGTGRVQSKGRSVVDNTPRGSKLRSVFVNLYRGADNEQYAQVCLSADGGLSVTYTDGDLRETMSLARRAGTKLGVPRSWDETALVTFPAIICAHVDRPLDEFRYGCEELA